MTRIRPLYTLAVSTHIYISVKRTRVDVIQNSVTFFFNFGASLVYNVHIMYTVSTPKEYYRTSIFLLFVCLEAYGNCSVYLYILVVFGVMVILILANS